MSLGGLTGFGVWLLVLVASLLALVVLGITKKQSIGFFSIVPALGAILSLVVLFVNDYSRPVVTVGWIMLVLMLGAWFVVQIGSK